MRLKDLLKNNSVKGAVEGLGTVANGIIDKVVTNETERAEVKTNFAKLFTEFQTEYERELTKRHAADMASDSWLSKNIRPLTLVVIVGLYTIFSITDGNIFEFNINDSYVTLLGEWGQTVMYFYFGGRSIEKISNIVTNFKTTRK
jgi:hypothetical protein